jgi:hypothetical protein
MSISNPDHFQKLSSMNVTWASRMIDTGETRLVNAGFASVSFQVQSTRSLRQRGGAG